MKTTRLALIAATALGFALPTATAEEPNGDLAQLQGSWTAMVGRDKDVPLTLAIKDDTAEIVVKPPGGEEIRLKGRIKIDDKATPKTIDWIDFITPKGDNVPENLGIYKLEGDTWTTCSGGLGNPRPSKFEEGEGGPPTIAAWTRVKEKTDDKPIAGDLARFQGTWTGKAGEDDDIEITLTIKTNAVTARWERGDGTEVEFKGEIRVDDKASPRTVDFVHFKRSDDEEVGENLGVYAFDGDDRVTIQTGGPGNERPRELKPGDEAGPHAFVLTRKKD